MTRVGTGGPCAHCGRVSSPCWRKGPPEKPLLCNACGARFLVKHSLEGYVPNAKPVAKREGASGPKPKKEAGLRALAVAGRPAGEKRKRTLSKRFADDQDDSLPFHGSFVSEPDFRRTVVVRHHRDGRCTVDRGTQTYGGLTADAKVFDAGQPLQEDFKGLAATLALLRQSPANSSEATSGTSTPTPPRCRRKPPRPTARTLF